MNSEYSETTRSSFVDMGTLLQQTYHKSWKDRTSGTSRYELFDFVEDDASHKDAQRSVLEQFSSIRWYLGGVLVFAVLTLCVVSALIIADIFLTISQFAALIFLAGILAMLIDLRGMRRAIKIAENAQSGYYEMYHTIRPGFGFCQIGVGSQGISIDGGHFLYLVEWEEIAECVLPPMIAARRNHEYLDCLIAPGGFRGQDASAPVLRIPRRFFDDPPSNISWEEMLKLGPVQRRLRKQLA